MISKPKHVLDLIEKGCKRAHEIEEDQIFELPQAPFYAHYAPSFENNQWCVRATKDLKKGEPAGCLPVTFTPEDLDRVFIRANATQLSPLCTDTHLTDLDPHYCMFCNISDLMNHKCGNGANIKPGPIAVFEETETLGAFDIARHDIKKGEELFCDYGGIGYYECDDYTFPCNCQEADCVKQYRGLERYPQKKIQEMLEAQEICIFVLVDLFAAYPKPKREALERKYLPAFPEIERILYAYLQERRS